jgi:hypothetical protein
MVCAAKNLGMQHTADGIKKAPLPEGGEAKRPRRAKGERRAVEVAGVGTGGHGLGLLPLGLSDWGRLRWLRGGYKKVRVIQLDACRNTPLAPLVNRMRLGICQGGHVRNVAQAVDQSGVRVWVSVSHALH